MTEDNRGYKDVRLFDALGHVDFQWPENPVPRRTLTEEEVAFWRDHPGSYAGIDVTNPEVFRRADVSAEAEMDPFDWLDVVLLSGAMAFAVYLGWTVWRKR